MHKIKSHKSVEQIAKKHRLDVSFIKTQLKMGVPIEHEHTGDKDLATDIALQHLDEIPDYYTRLKKMETSAKKEHKKFKDVKEYAEAESNLVDDMDSSMMKHAVHSIHVEHDKRYCPKCKEVQLRSECKYGQRYWDMFSLPGKLKEETKSGDEGLHDWFNKSKSSDGKSGWVQLGGKWAGKPCARQPNQTSTPKCGSSKIAANLSPEEEERARKRKNRLDPNQTQKTGAAKPTNVRTEEMDLQEVKDNPSKGSGKKDACYNKVKSRYDVWPSAYASGALVKCRKVGAANWGTKSEETMHEEERYCPLCDKRETRSECSYGGKTWDKVSVKDHEYSMARSELDTLIKAAERIKSKVGKGEGSLEAWVQSKITKAADYIDTAADYINSGEMEEATSPSQQAAIAINMKKRGVKPKNEEKLVDKILGELQEEDPCWKGYTQVGMKKKGGKEVPNCVSSNGAKGYKKEDVTIEDANGNIFAEVVDIIKPEPIKGFKSQVEEATRLQAETGNIISVILSWRGKTYCVKMFFPQVNTPSKKDVSDEINKIYPNARVLQYEISNICPGQPLIQVLNSRSKNYLITNKTIGEETAVEDKPVTKEEKRKVKLMQKLARLKAAAKAPAIVSDIATKEEVEIKETAAWQRKEGKNPEGGLNKKGIASYRREHPGSHLSLAVTTKPSKLKPGSKAANRRKSFCARMGGMPGPMKDEKGRPTRKALSLRKWNC